MKTDAITPADFGKSVISVPPMAWDNKGKVSVAENRKIVDYMMGGGVTTFLYGGNANFYHVGVDQYVDVVDMLLAIAPQDAWMIPSIGADFGKAMDQMAILRSFSFPTAMVLPMAGPTRPAGVATGLRRLADVFGRPLIAYVRGENYLAPRDAAALIADGVVCSIKYGVDRKNPTEDAYLSSLIEATGTERLVSGIGERPAIVHWTKFGIRAFTSGSVTIAPRLSTAVLNALKAGDVAAAERIREKFLAFEDQRDAYSLIVVLHEAVRLAGIADTGPIQPFLAGLDEAVLRPVGEAAKALFEENARHVRRQAA